MFTCCQPSDLTCDVYNQQTEAGSSDSSTLWGPRCRHTKDLINAYYRDSPLSAAKRLTGGYGGYSVTQPEGPFIMGNLLSGKPA